MIYTDFWGREKQRERSILNKFIVPELRYTWVGTDVGD